ncbi:Protein NRT1/ PTR FAMILY 5.5 [Bienertia sinuspersici]
MKVQFQKWVNIFANYILWLMMVYLTDVWELELVHAAAIINIWMGLIKVLPIVFAYLADAFLGNFVVVFFSTLSSMIGLGLIWMSTPPVLGNSNGNCTQYKPECIGEQQKQLLYTGLAFTAVGMAAHTACYAPFASEQAEGGGGGGVVASDSCDCYVACCCVGCRIHLIAFVALLVASFVKPWATLFGICAIVGAISFIVCFILMLISCYNNSISRPQGSPLTTVFRVLFAAFSKSFYPRPLDPSELYEKTNITHHELLPRTENLRCLEKAAIIKDEPSLQEQEKKRWNLCEVTEVEETKLAIRTIPIWMTFIVCGIISSLNATYFLEQAKTLDPRVGKAKTPLILLFWLYDHFKSWFFPNFCLLRYFVTHNNDTRYYYYNSPRVGIIIAMMYATLSCIAAAKIETRRLGVIKVDGLIDEKIVPMTIFWLLPQYALLGGLDGLYSLFAYNFSVDQAPISMIKYFHLFARGFFGLGVIASVVSVYIVGRLVRQ